MKILGIETSCDETAAAVVKYERGRFSVLSNVVASQSRLHAKTGGVVPEVAARRHVEAIIPVIKQALRESGIKPQRLNLKPPLDAIAVTVGPGLITSLRVGVDTARALAAVWGVPVVGVNHLEGHIYSNWLRRNENRELRTEIIFPALALIVSGGHTELVLMRKHLDYQIIGATRDDAAGEAFDKVAKLLGLPYPGGPALAKLAERGNRQAINFPRPMIDSHDFDFSFSGLKTAVLYYLKQLRTTNYVLRTNVCASFEQAVVDVLVAKTIRAAKKYKVKTVLLGGGVAANKYLRKQLADAVKQKLRITHYALPVTHYTTDNAAMIAAAGAFHIEAGRRTRWQRIQADPNLTL